MDELSPRLLRLIVGRFVLVGGLVSVSRLALPPEAFSVDFRPPFLLTLVLLTGIYLLIWKYADLDEVLYQVQFNADLILVSTLLFFSGGFDSPFTPLYVLIIVYASLLKGREGGILALTLSVISYVGMIHLGYLGWIPGETSNPAYTHILYQLAVNLLAFISVAFLGIYLSERLRKAARELGAAKVVQENIIESMRSGLLTLDLEGRITFCNQVGARILAFEADRAPGMRLEEFFPHRVVEQILHTDYSSSSRGLRLEDWISRRRGEQVYLGIGCAPLLSQAHDKEGYLVSFQDLTDIQKREEEFQFREKMAAIGEMAAGLAHELRNPLGSLSGSIQLLRGELKLSREQARLLDIVLRESERLNRIVGNFLAYAGPQPTMRQPVDLGDLLRETLELFRNSPEFEEQLYRIEVDNQAGDCLCLGNPDQLRQVLWNILQNGIRAMPAGGRMFIELSSANGRTRIRIRDEGTGMTEEQKDKLFQPFAGGFKKGMGLGMAIVYQIVQQHDGEIEVITEPGKGTAIEILLPRENVD